ncbi:MAG: hypothetical protein ACOX1P_18080 [Thermoguttaceae bacterium]|jgi:hypothetical protein
MTDSPLPRGICQCAARSTRIYPGPRRVFATDRRRATRLVIGGVDKPASDAGHIVLRVVPGGGSSRVGIVNDASESHRVRNIFGPYLSG